MRKLLLTIALVLTASWASAAGCTGTGSCFWVGGTGNTNDTAHWATTTGGATTGGLPGSGDNCTWDSASNATGYTVTVNAALTCLARNIGAPASGTLTYAGTAPNSTDIRGADTIAATGVSYTYSGDITYSATTSVNITPNAISYPSTTVTFNGVGGTWTLQGNWTISGNNVVTLTAGTLALNGKTLSSGACNFHSTGATTRALDLTNGTLVANDFQITSTGMTLTTTGSTLTISGAFVGAGLTYATVSLAAGSNSLCTLGGADSFSTLSFIGGSNRASVGYSLDSSITVTGTLSINATSFTSRLWINSTIIGTPHTITAAAISNLNNIDFQDITGAGAATWTGTSVGDGGNNSGITFTTPVTRYWVAFSGGSWNATSSWSASDGGASGATMPLLQDTAIINNNSITSGSRTITINQGRIGAVDFTGVLNSPTLTLTATGVQIFFFGSVNLGAGTSGIGTLNGTAALAFYGRGTCLLTSGTKTFAVTLGQVQVGGTLRIVDTFSSSSTLNQVSGTLDLNSQTAQFTTMQSIGSATRNITGPGTIVLSGPNNCINIASTGFTFSGSPNFKLTDASSTSKTITGGGLSGASLWITGAGTGTYTISGNNTWSDFRADTPPHTIIITAASTQTITTWTVSGTAGNLMTLQSSSAGSAWNLVDTTGTNTCDYCSIKDSHASGGAIFNATNSTNVSGNTGWLFPGGFFTDF